MPVKHFYNPLLPIFFERFQFFVKPPQPEIAKCFQPGYFHDAGKIKFLAFVGFRVPEENPLKWFKNEKCPKDGLAVIRKPCFVENIFFTVLNSFNWLRRSSA